MQTGQKWSIFFIILSTICGE